MNSRNDENCKNAYNDECSICMEEYNNLDIIKLNCNHIFHNNCMLRYIETKYKELSNKLIFCNKLRCPLCRYQIKCIDINKLIYYKYKHYMSLYKNIKNDIRLMKIQNCIFSRKFFFKKLFTKISYQEAFNYVINKENLLEMICKKKKELYDTRKLLNTYEILYYRRCICIYLF